MVDTFGDIPDGQQSGSLLCQDRRLHLLQISKALVCAACHRPEGGVSGCHGRGHHSNSTANHDDNQHSYNENIRIQNIWDGVETISALMTM